MQLGLCVCAFVAACGTSPAATTPPADAGTQAADTQHDSADAVPLDAFVDADSSEPDAAVTCEFAALTDVREAIEMSPSPVFDLAWFDDALLVVEPGDSGVQATLRSAEARDVGWSTQIVTAAPVERVRIVADDRGALLVWAEAASRIGWVRIELDGTVVAESAGAYELANAVLVDVYASDGVANVIAFDNEAWQIGASIAIGADSGELQSVGRVHFEREISSLAVDVRDGRVGAVWTETDVTTTPARTSAWFGYLDGAFVDRAIELPGPSLGGTAAVVADASGWWAAWRGDAATDLDLTVAHVVDRSLDETSRFVIEAAAFPMFGRTDDEVWLVVQGVEVDGIEFFWLLDGRWNHQSLVATPGVKAMLPNAARRGDRLALRWWAWDAASNTRGFLHVFDLCRDGD